MTFAIIALAGLTAAGQPPLIETPAAAPGFEESDGRQVYRPAYFVSIAPRTAADMLGEIPGFTVTQSGGGRGLGQGGTNVLINGARVTGKGTGPVDILERTPASTVDRIEIVDAASLGIPGLSGQVADVYITAKGLTGQWSWNPTFRRALEPDLANSSLSISGETGDIAYTIGFENDGFRGGNQGPEIVTGPGGEIIERRDEDGQFYAERPGVTLAATWTRPSGAIANLSASYQHVYFSRDERRDVLLDGGTAQVIDSGRKENERNGELSADYATDAFGGRLKLIGLASFEHSPNEFRFFDRRNGVVAEASFFDQTVDEGERIVRAEQGWQAFGGSLELAAEGAFNFLEAESVGGDIDDDGALVPDGDPDTVRVEELRAQASLAYARALGPFDVQSSIGLEASEISQPGAASPARTFVRPNGFVSASYAVGDDTDLRLRLERAVGQLNFFDFVSSVDLTNDTESCGNEAIVPQQSWLLEGQAERRFGARSSVTLRAYAERITDRVDRVPLPCGADGPGNIDEASVYGGSATGTIALDRVWGGAELEFFAAGRESRLDDPLTGQPRAFSGDEEWEWSIDLRRDVPNSAWAYGMGAEQLREAARFRFDEIGREVKTVETYVFVEHRDVFGAELNVTVSNATDQEERFERAVFDADAALPGQRGPLLFTETRARTYGPRLQISLTNTF